MKKRTQDELLHALIEIADELGWFIAVPAVDEQVPGIVLGDKDFIQYIAQCCKETDIEIYSTNETNGELEIETPVPKKTKGGSSESYH